MDGYTDRARRTDEAMGEAIYALFQKRTAEGKGWDDSPPTFPTEFEKARDKELESLDEHERDLLAELCSFFDPFDRKEGNEEGEVARAREIIEELSMNVNFAALPYGETFLSSAVYRGLGMVELLIEKGADVNLENELLPDCAIDHLLEEEDDNGGLSAEMKAMKQLLLSKGAKTVEERWLAKAEEIRGGDKDDSGEEEESDDWSEDDSENEW